MSLTDGHLNFTLVDNIVSNPQEFLSTPWLWQRWDLQLLQHLKITTNFNLPTAFLDYVTGDLAVAYGPASPGP